MKINESALDTFQILGDFLSNYNQKMYNTTYPAVLVVNKPEKTKNFDEDQLPEAIEYAVKCWFSGEQKVLIDLDEQDRLGDFETRGQLILLGKRFDKAV